LLNPLIADMLGKVIDISSKTCEFKNGLFGRCGAEAAGLCQYCGRPFCAKHGVVLDDDQQVCNRKVCLAKRMDLLRHLEYKAAAEELNEAGVCGLPGCNAQIGAQCTRCQAYFCPRHAFGREELVLENRVRVRRMASLCKHCADRRPLWAQR